MKKILFAFIMLFLSLECLPQVEVHLKQIMQNGIIVPNQSSRIVSNFAPDNILYWVGEGTNEVVAIFYWCQNSQIGLAYGYRFNGTKTIDDMLTDLANVDPRLTISFNGSLINSYTYIDETYNLSIASSGSLTYTVNGVWAGGLTDPLADGDLFEMQEWGNCSTPTNIIPATIPSSQGELPDDAAIDESEIIYWVGEGSHHIILAVNWCDSAIAFAWGYRFQSDSVLLSDLMNAIAIADPRFDLTTGAWGISDITYQDADYQLALAGNWWVYNINGQGAMLGYDAQYVSAGDFVKWGDEMCAVSDTNYNYVWITPIQPVSLPDNGTEYFDGIVGTSGCQAIYCENPAILGWATGCEIYRGYQDIALSEAMASYGSAQDAVGAVTISTMEVVSLGDGGEAVLTFELPISNGVGYDFAVFENALNDLFLEMAFVEVSSDGVNYVRFPAVSFTQTAVQIDNNGAVDATLVHNLAGKYRAGWGTPFDLEELSNFSILDINNITHIKLIDVVGSIDPDYGSFDSRGNLVNDPYPTNFASGGFDLAGVAVLNGWSPEAIQENSSELSSFYVYPNPCNDRISCNLEIGEEISLYNAQGKLLYHEIATSNTLVIDMQYYTAGFYFVKSNCKITKIIKN